MASLESQDKQKLSKSEKKAARKQAKSQHMLLKHDGIRTSETPSKFLLTGNGGLLNSISQEQLSTLFSQYGDVKEIIMLPGKPYSFVCFRELESAVMAHENLQGYSLLEGQGPTNLRMYLSYVEQVPTIPLTAGIPPPGLIVLDNFIDEEMENNLLKSVQWENQGTSEAGQYLKHRRVKHHGYEFLYTTNNIDKDHPLPDGIPSIYGHVIDDIMQTGHVQCRPDQVTINQYQPGQGIPPHIDTHSAFEDAIISLSLGSQVLMEFSHPDGRHTPVLLPRRSLLIMTGESRYLWSHGITPRKNDVVPSETGDAADNKKGLTLLPRGVRTSLTLRAIRRQPCRCDYASQCDSQQTKTVAMATKDNKQSASLPTSEQEAAILEQTHVHEVYEKIAEHFSDTRHKPWPRVAHFLTKLDPGCVVVDVGCGNGKYLGVNSSLYMVGCDRSSHLVDISRQHQFEAFTSDALVLPLRTNTADACICIAVIHHFSTQARREKAVQEIVRILRTGGIALIYVWAVEQERGKQKSNYLKDSKKHNKQFVNCDKSQAVNDKEDHQSESLRNSGGESALKTSQSGASSQTDLIDAKHRIENNVTNAMENLCNLKIMHGKVDSSNLGSADKKNLCPPSCQEPSIAHASDQDCRDNKLPVHKNRTEFVKPDLLVPWHLRVKKSAGLPSNYVSQTDPDQSVVYHRYYHVFKEGELETLCLSVGHTKIVESYYDQGNWCVVFQKNDDF